MTGHKEQKAGSVGGLKAPLGKKKQESTLPPVHAERKYPAVRGENVGISIGGQKPGSPATTTPNEFLIKQKKKKKSWSLEKFGRKTQK